MLPHLLQRILNTPNLSLVLACLFIRSDGFVYEVCELASRLCVTARQLLLSCLERFDINIFMLAGFCQLLDFLHVGRAICFQRRNPFACICQCQRQLCLSCFVSLDALAALVLQRQEILAALDTYLYKFVQLGVGNRVSGIIASKTEHERRRAHK